MDTIVYDRRVENFFQEKTSGTIENCRYVIAGLIIDNPRMGIESGTIDAEEEKG